jgi:hypothetical protein
MRFRGLVISAAFAIGLAALPLSVARRNTISNNTALLVVSPDLALLRRGCRRRHRRDDCDPASAGAYRSATLPGLWRFWVSDRAAFACKKLAPISV